LKLPEYHIISDYCIGADGAVDSVFIFSNCPIEEVEILQLDPQSRSSNNLAKVLLKNYWKKNPRKIEEAEDYSKSTHSKTAYVQIGDRTFGRAKDHAYAYDLAEEWKKFTNLPFVFAAWVSNKKLSEEFIFRLNAAFQYGLNHRKEVISKLPVNTSFDYDDYLTNKIDFALNAKKREALDLFHKLIKELDE
jgi:chorismate dehydratase